jgi:hypothetical protein
LKKPLAKRAGGVAQGVDPECKPQYCKKKKKKGRRRRRINKIEGRSHVIRRGEGEKKKNSPKKKKMVDKPQNHQK